MKLSADQIAESVAAARDYLNESRLAFVAGSAISADHAAIARDFASALIQTSARCVIGLPCEEHGGAAHGQEAEELRAGIEQIISDIAAVRGFVEIRRSLIALLDRVDARDSLAFREGTNIDGANDVQEAPNRE